MNATRIFSSYSQRKGFAELADGTYRYLRDGWVTTPCRSEAGEIIPTLLGDGPDQGWVEEGLASGDVEELAGPGSTTLKILNKVIDGTALNL